MLSEADIRDLGVRNGAHRARLVSSLVMLREVQQRHGKTFSSLHRLKAPSLNKFELDDRMGQVAESRERSRRGDSGVVFLPTGMESGRVSLPRL